MADVPLWAPAQGGLVLEVTASTEDRLEFTPWAGVPLVGRGPVSRLRTSLAFP